MSALPVTLSVLLLLIAGGAIARLPALHPIQLWTVPWAAAACLYATNLLPYAPLSVETFLLVLGCSAAFACGALAGEVIGRRFPPATPATDRVERAAVLLLVVTGIGLGLFFAQSMSRFGVGAVVVSSSEVREALGAGELTVTIKYVYAALAAASVCGAAAGLRAGRRRATWLFGVAVAAASTYFSTGRSTPVLALLFGLLAFGVAGRIILPPRRLLAAALASALLALAALIIGGSMIGKTFENSELATIDTVFTRHELLEELALPYQYATAPIAALDVLVRNSTAWGWAEGCATAAPICSVAAEVGLPATAVPSIRPFTQPPLAWNTYTAIDAPLLDGGLVLAPIIVLLLGAAAGVAWAAARRGQIVALIAFSALGTATIFSTVQNNYLAPHFLGAMLLAAAALVCGSISPPPWLHIASVRLRTSRS